MTGWIQLHRKMTEWEWYTDINTCHLFIHLLISANHKTAKHQGQIIKSGELKTGRIKLSAETGLSEQQIRTSLKRLESTSEITITKYNKYSIISITNWNDYQSKNHKSTSETTSNQPAINQQLTTNNNENNDNNEKKREAHTNFSNLELSEEGMKIASENGITGDHLLKCWKKFKVVKVNCTMDNWFKAWQKWVIDERVPTTKESLTTDKLTGDELLAQQLGTVVWLRDRKMFVSAKQDSDFKRFTKETGIDVTWRNAREWREQGAVRLIN